MVDDLVFADAVDAALDILEPLAATEAIEAETLVNQSPNGVTITHRGTVTSAAAQIAAMRAAEAAWRAANP